MCEVERCLEQAPRATQDAKAEEQLPRRGLIFSLKIRHMTNVVGTNPQVILSAFEEIMKTGEKAGNIPEKWDGKAAERIVQFLEGWISAST